MKERPCYETSPSFDLLYEKNITGIEDAVLKAFNRFGISPNRSRSGGISIGYTFSRFVIEFNYDENKVPKFTLPELLKANDGSKITASEDWKKTRRPEVLKLFEDHVFELFVH